MEIKYSVKDNENLLSHNVWSGGDYLNSTTGISPINCTVTLSDECYNGNHSFYLLRDSSSTMNASGRFLYNHKFHQEYDGKTLIFKARIKTPNNYTMLQVYDGSKYTEIKVPQNNNFEETTITLTIDYQNTYTFAVNIHKNIDTYIDDIKLILQ